MTFNLIVLLYSVSGMIANVFYIPQVWLYLKRVEARGTISLITWGGWMICGIITFAYAVIEVGKIEMMLVTGFNAAAQIFIFALGVWYRIKPDDSRRRQRQQLKRAFSQRPAAAALQDNEINFVNDQDALKLLVLMLTHFSRVCGRYKRRFYRLRSASGRPERK
jgi:hypothetical protein